MADHSLPVEAIAYRMYLNLLKNWNSIMDHGDLKEAKEIMLVIDECYKVWDDPALDYLYKIARARYYRAIGKRKYFALLMDELEDLSHNFYDEHNHYYHRLAGLDAWGNRLYKDAIEEFHKAELADTGEWGDAIYYYAYGACLTEMGYINKSIKYLLRAKEMAEKNDFHKYDIYIQGYLASNYCLINNSDEALNIMNKCILIEKEKKNTSVSMAFAYLALGDIYYKNKRYGEALTFIDIAIPYTPEDSEMRVRCMYEKAQVLISSGDIEQGIIYTNDGINKSTIGGTWGDVWKALLIALEFSTELSEPESMDYMLNRAIPSLLEHGQYYEAIGYYKTISKYYEEAGDKDKALYFSNVVHNIYDDLIMDKMKGGV